MPITVNCLSCHSSQTVAESSSSQRVDCLHCGAPLVVPAIEDNPYAPPMAPLERPEGDGPLAVPGSVLGKFGLAFHLLISNLALFSLIVLTVWLPGNLALEWIAFNAPEGGARAGFRPASMIEGLFGPIYAGGLIYALSKRMRGERVTYGEAIAVGFRSWGRLFGARWFTAFWVILGLIAFIIPGVVLQVRYSLLDAVVILEGANGPEARRRSTRLTEGRRWSIFFAGILFFGTFVPFSFAVGLVPDEFEEAQTMWAAVVLDCALDVLATILTIVLFLFYWEARSDESAANAGAGPADSA
jgi:hypothetical protein